MAAALTKQAIYSSFLGFLEKKPLDKITVKDIVDDCKINRKTFYYYFSDIYAMTEELFRDRLAQIRENLPPGEYSWLEAMKESSGFMFKNKKMALHVFKSVGYEKMSNLIYETCLEYLPPLIEETADGLSISESDMKLIVKYGAISISGMIARWLEEEMKDEPGEMIERFDLIMKGTLRLALENADRLNKSRT